MDNTITHVKVAASGRIPRRLNSAWRLNGSLWLNITMWLTIEPLWLSIVVWFDVTLPRKNMFELIITNEIIREVAKTENIILFNSLFRSH